MHKLEREHWFIIIVVFCAIVVLITLDSLDDNAPADFQVASTIIQDVGYVCIGIMLMLLLMLMVESLRDRIKLKELQKELDDLKRK